MTDYILTMRCPDSSGIIHAVTGALLDVQGNILEQAQFTDETTGNFCIRTRFETPLDDVAQVRLALMDKVSRFDPVLTVRPEQQRYRVLLMVSKADHCLIDLLYRVDNGELPIEVAAVVSNHLELKPIADRHSIPFVHIPVAKDTKADAEAALLAIVEEMRIDLVVLARYMQVLSDDLCQRLSGRVINIHHSFLPGFKGARPYQQAYERGVKLIGATSHFVTADLDEGPIIEQEVARVAHHHTAEDLAEIGRDLERLVLARAVRLFAEDRIILQGSRTVVFP